MKRHLFYILACLVLVGCSDKYSEDLGLFPALTPRYLSVTPNTMSFAATTTESETLSITSVKTPWKLENPINWISLSINSGSSSSNISVGVNENTSGDESRTGVFYFKADISDWNYESPISVTQSGAIPAIVLSKYEIDFSGTTNNESVSVTSNCTWNVSSASDWISVSQKNNVITISATSNETSSYRTATVSVSHTGTTAISKKITIRQAPASINASTESLVFNNTASSVNVTISAEASWTATTSSSWIEITSTSGSKGTSVMTVSVSPNASVDDRTGYVVLSIGGNQRIQIPLRQRGIYVETEQTELSFAAAGGSSSLSVLSNTSWTISSVPSWITVSPGSGAGNGQVKVTAAENPYTTSRTGIIRLTQTGMNIDMSISVTQSGKTFDVNATVLNFADKQAVQTISIETDGTWSAKASDSWISVSPPSASGNSVLSVSVSENTGDNERSGQVVVTMADKSVTINVVQQGKYFTISNDLLTYSSKGGNINVSISTNDSWSAKIENEVSWLKLSNTGGTGTINVAVTATDNPSVNSRSAAIIFETTYSQSVRVLVTQDARYLKVDTRELLLYSKGGTSEVVTISTDGTYTINSSDSWFTVLRSGNTFTVVASENSTTEPRIGNVTISLSDLKEGTYSLNLPIKQLNYGASFFRDAYGDDVNYDQPGHSDGSLIISGYGGDEDWDTSGNSNVTLSVSGYKTDVNWDSSSSSGVTVSVTGFNSDKDLDPTNMSSGDVSKTEFDSDNNWE